MNIRKSSFTVLGLVFGVSVILYIFDVPIVPSSNQLTPTISIPTVVQPSPVNNTSAHTLQPSLQSPTSNARKYSETITYQPEGRNESITVSVTLINNTVSDLVSQHSMNDGKSRRYQLDFEAEIRPLVVGKNIKTLNLSRVAGASFTTDAFMQAIDAIRSKI